MLNNITSANIPISNIVYNHDTRLFSYSPRREIDEELVRRLKKSIQESGMWQGIVVRADTMEGIAGNHRFLACLEIAREKGSDLALVTIPAVLVDCDEGMAVSIALMENEFRENLTQWEKVRSLLRASKQKPSTVETVFDVDGKTVKQLQFWEDRLDHEAELEQRRRDLSSRLTREWIQTINNLLGEYPELREHFLNQLQYPAWVRAQTLEELEKRILGDLCDYGIKFERGKTWNDIPPLQCLNNEKTFDEIKTKIEEGTLNVRSDGSLPGCCHSLRLIPQFAPQFIPTKDGDVLSPLPMDEAAYQYPEETISPDGNHVRGKRIHLLKRVSAYCVATNVHAPGSCFHRLEAARADVLRQKKKAEGVPVELPEYLEAIEEAERYVWENPQIEGQPCKFATCHHASEDPPGCVVILLPDEQEQSICLHEECGSAAQEALIDWEARQRELEKQRYREALNQLQQLSVLKTLFSSPEERIDLHNQALLEEIEAVLIPNWDTLSMFHVVTGWQLNTRKSIARRLGLDDIHHRKVMKHFRAQYENLSKKPKEKTKRRMFQMLREKYIQSEQTFYNWVACLALVRIWRDNATTKTEVSEMMELINDLSLNSRGQG